MFLILWFVFLLQVNGPSGVRVLKHVMKEFGWETGHVNRATQRYRHRAVTVHLAKVRSRTFVTFVPSFELCVRLFILLSVRLFVRLFAHSFSFVCSFVCLFLRSFFRLSVKFFVHSFVHLFVSLFLRSFLRSLPRWERVDCSFLRVPKCSFVRLFVRSSVCAFASSFARYMNKTVDCSLGSFQKFVLTMDYIIMAVLTNLRKPLTLGVLSCFDDRSKPAADCYSVTLAFHSRIPLPCQVVRLFCCFFQQICKPRLVWSLWYQLLWCPSWQQCLSSSSLSKEQTPENQGQGKWKETFYATWCILSVWRPKCCKIRIITLCSLCS